MVQLIGKYSEETPETIKKLLEEFADLFSDDLKNPAFNITLKDTDINISSAPSRRLSLGLQDKVRKQIAEWLVDDIIEPSDSLISSPIVMARKKNGEFRLCVDYRSLNKITKPLPYPMQHIGSVLERIRGSKFFSKLDLSSGFLQVPMDRQSAHLTTFTTPDGLESTIQMTYL